MCIDLLYTTDEDLNVPVERKRALYDAFNNHYRLTPTDLRNQHEKKDTAPGTIVVRVGYRPPYRFQQLLSFFRDRALERVESVDGSSYARTVMIASADRSIASGWIRVEDEPGHDRLIITMADSLAPVVPEVISRVRRMFDTDSDPASIVHALTPLEEHVPGVKVEGTRVPGCFDAFETACRAVIGQQISVKAANKLAARIAERYGETVDTDVAGLDRAWPSASTVRSLANIEDAFGELGLIKTRSRTIAALAKLIDEGALDLDPEALVEEQMEALLAVKGIGPWSANYIAMRTLGYPDAFLETDAGIAHALPDLSPKERIALADRCHPWRSYAVLALWNSLS